MRMAITHRVVVKIKAQYVTQQSYLLLSLLLLNAMKKSEYCLYCYMYIIVVCVHLDNSSAYL